MSMILAGTLMGTHLVFMYMVMITAVVLHSMKILCQTPHYYVCPLNETGWFYFQPVSHIRGILIQGTLINLEELSIPCLLFYIDYLMSKGLSLVATIQ